MKITKAKIISFIVIFVLFLFLMSSKVQASELYGTVETGKGYNIEYIINDDDTYTIRVKYDRDMKTSGFYNAMKFIDNRTVELNARNSINYFSHRWFNYNESRILLRSFYSFTVYDNNSNKIYTNPTEPVRMRKGEKGLATDTGTGRYKQIYDLQSMDSSIVKVNNGNELEAVGVGKTIVKGKYEKNGELIEYAWIVDVLDSQEITVHDKNLYSALFGKLAGYKYDVWDSRWSDETNSATFVLTDEELKQINYLDLKARRIKDISGLEKFKYLNSLDLSKNPIDNIEVVSQISSLTELYLKGCGIKDISFVKKLPNLEVLDIYQNAVTDISALSGLNKLRILDVRDNKYVENYKMQSRLENVSVISNLPSLTQLAINTPLIDKIDSAKLKSLSRLEIKYDVEKTALDSNQMKIVEDIIANKTIPDFSMNEWFSVMIKENQMELPKLFQEARDSSNLMYSPEGFALQNCTIDGNRVIVELGKTYATVKIKSGRAAGTCLNISTPSVDDITFSDENLYKAVLENIENTINKEEYSADNSTKTIKISNEAKRKIVELNLSSKNITDLTGLEKFTFLKSLNLNNNAVTNFGNINSLQYLESLRINNNNLQDFKKLSNLIRLKRLHAINNNFSNIDKIENLYALETLMLSNNSISDITELSKLKKLKNINLDNNKISDISPLYGKKLSVVNINENNISSINNLDFEYGAFQCNNINVTLSNSRELELPDIFKQAKNSSSKIYSEDGFDCSGCELRNDIIIIQNGVEEATVMINSGYAAGTTLVIKVERDLTPPEANIKYDLNDDETEMTVTIEANEEIKNILSWERKDRNTIYKKFQYNVVEQSIEIEDFDGNKTTKNISVTGVKNPKIPDLTVKYSTIKPTRDDVTVTLSSSESLAGGYFGWEQCEDGKSIRKTYSQNTNHTATTESILTQEMLNAGMQPINIYIEISNIDKEAPICEVEYSTKSKTSGKVLVKIKAENDDISYAESDFMMWNIYIDKENKAIAYKDFWENTSTQVIVYDSVGNKSTVDINIDNIDKNIDDLMYQYNTIAPTNQNVNLNIEASENIFDTTKSVSKIGEELNKGNVIKLANTTMFDSGVILLADNTTNSANNSSNSSGNKIIKVYSENVKEVREIKDSAGNTVFVPVEVENIDKIDPIVENIEYIENSDGTVTVKMIFKEEIDFEDGLFNWRLSEDNKVLTKTFDTKDIYEFVEIKDHAGNVIYVLARYNDYIDSDAQAKPNTPENDTTQSDKELPQTGKGIAIVALIILLVIIITFNKNKLKGYKNIK